MSLMVVEMVIKIIMKAANLMCRVVHESQSLNRSDDQFGKRTSDT